MLLRCRTRHDINNVTVLDQEALLAAQKEATRLTQLQARAEAERGEFDRAQALPLPLPHP